MTVVISAAVTETAADPCWPWPIDLARYDRRPELSERESTALASLGWQVRRRRGYDPDRVEWRAIDRLLRPLDDARASLRWCPDTPAHRRSVTDAVGLILRRCLEDGTSFWAWSADDWVRLIGPGHKEFEAAWPGWIDGTVRPYVAAFAYLLGGFTDFHRIGGFIRRSLAWRVFGQEPVEEAIAQVAATLQGWGYHPSNGAFGQFRTVLVQIMLINRSPLLQDMTTDALERVRESPALPYGARRGNLHGVHRAIAALGYADPPPKPVHGVMPDLEGVPESWAAAVERWHDTSTLTPKVRGMFRSVMAKAGRWLAAECPDVVEPAQWTRETCAAWVAALDRMTVGEYVQRQAGVDKRGGEPLSPRTKAGYLTATRTFFRDCQEWEWIPRRFDPVRALATPRSVAALIGPNPRVIADDIWAKLLWAGLNVDPEDFPTNTYGLCYPIDLIRAVTLTWLFSGLRSDEIARLRMGCIRWQHDGFPIPGDSDEVLARDAVCLLDIPTHKTGTSFTKPVDPLLGKAIEAWQELRPQQPKMLDRKTGEQVDFLFAHRAKRLAKTYINTAVIPSLCRKAGVPTADVRGNITSHRARSTIASQLYNAKEPMTLFELQAWLGHRSPQSTQYYAKITPNTLTKAYTEAGYFARNVRTVEVLLDRDAITSGAAATGEPWQYYDLGHGLCSYSFFEQCQHRMACARCDFYTPKESTKAQLVEAKANLQRMLVSIPLTEEERAAVDDGQSALDRLLERLAEVATPAGPTPSELRAEPGRPLPLTVRSPPDSTDRKCC
ncbi:tyrosine-type recombinase/integrase [Kitasatospora sp. NPDC101155]|uniref:tyrosine-type recombinase/integrase n=1 Tax=Kitasatospora sp. NPDC101155 TaxID=3364097 RepID=UPI0038094FAD